MKEIILSPREDYIKLNRQNNRVYNCTLNSFGSTLMICLNVSPSSNPEEPQKPNSTMCDFHDFGLTFFSIILRSFWRVEKVK